MDLKNLSQWRIFNLLRWLAIIMGIINVGILCYLSDRDDIVFEGWPFDGFYCCLSLIVFRTLFSIATRKLADYIRQSDKFSAKQKTLALWFLALLNLATSIFNIPLIMSVMRLYRAQEILSNNSLFGTIRRILSPNEIQDLFNKNIPAYIEGLKTPPEIKALLKNWALAHFQDFVPQYAKGAVLAETTIQERVLEQKDIFAREILERDILEKLEKLRQKECVIVPAKTNVEASITDQIMAFVCNLNPWWAPNASACFKSWLFFLGVGGLGYIVWKDPYYWFHENSKNVRWKEDVNTHIKTQIAVDHEFQTFMKAQNDDDIQLAQEQAIFKAEMSEFKEKQTIWNGKINEFKDAQRGVNKLQLGTNDGLHKTTSQIIDNQNAIIERFKNPRTRLSSEQFPTHSLQGLPNIPLVKPLVQNKLSDEQRLRLMKEADATLNNDAPLTRRTFLELLEKILTELWI